jgi:integrase
LVRDADRELLALTFADVDTDAKTITINKSYQRIHGKDVITDPKTKKSNRVVSMPDTLAVELAAYKALFFKPDPGDRLFPFYRDRFYPVLTKCADKAGVKWIRIHDFRRKRQIWQHL